MKSKLFIGAHASIAGGYLNSLKSINFIGGNSVQIFLKSPRSRFSKSLSEDIAILTKNYLKENNIFLIGHSSYLLNFAKPFNENPWAVESLIDDLDKISRLGGVGVVLHIGKYLDMDKNFALNNIYKNVSLVLEKTSSSVKIIFENTAGQGTEIGFKFRELGEIFNLFSDKEKNRIGFCLDTCHSHVAGYDLSVKSGVLNWKNEFDKFIGWDKVVCIHFNDAKKICGSRIDRHEDLGFGTIGINGLKEVAKICFKTKKPMILETPSENQNYIDQISMVKNWF